MQLPHRIDAPNQALGFRKARQGEAISAETGKEAELYPLCSSTMLEELDSFGVGISLYFRQLLALFAVAALCALILLTSGLYNASTCDSDEIEDESIAKGGRDLVYTQTASGMYMAKGSAAGCLRTDLSVRGTSRRTLRSRHYVISGPHRGQDAEPRQVARRRERADGAIIRSSYGTRRGTY